MIQTLSIQNFKVLREVDVQLRPFTLIVGPNASGKSSILEAFCCAAKAAESVEIPDQLRSRNSSNGLRIFLAGWRKKAPFASEIRAGRSRVRSKGTSSPAPTMLRHEVKKLAAVSRLAGVSLTLPPDGEGLATILAGFSLEHPEIFNSIQERLRTVVPVVQRIRITRAQEGGEVGFLLLFDMKGGEGIPASAVSDGTLLTLGLLTALSAPEAPELVLIDDLERGLHPRALGELIQLLRKIQELNPELQIVATSHSPYLLDHLQAEEILLTALDEDGYAVVRSLAEHPDYERWKDVMAPGEFWSTVGESWVTAAKK